MAYPAYDSPMPYADAPPVLRRPRARRELLALVLMLIGIGGLLVCAFVWQPLAGFALLSILVCTIGLWLGYDPISG